MLSVAEDHLRALNPQARLEVFGQELNAETYAICRSDMMLKGQDASHIVYGNSFSEDGHEGRALRLPARQSAVRGGVEEGRGRGPRRGTRSRASTAGSAPGCRASTTARFLFLQHMISKMKPARGGRHRGWRSSSTARRCSPAPPARASREIRRWIIENDWLEAVVALPDQLFYNTGISTYFWIVTNRKAPERRGKVQLVDAREYFVKMRKSPRREAQGDQRRADRGDHPAVRRVHRGREGQDLPQRGVRLPADHRRAATAAAVGGHARDHRAAGRDQAVGEARRGRAGRPDRPPRRPWWARDHDRAGAMAKKLGPVPKAIEKALWDVLACQLTPRRPSSPTEGRAGAGPGPAGQRERASARRSRSRG